MSELKTNKISPFEGTELTLGDSGDTITIPAGATLAGDGSNLTNIASAAGGKVLQVVQSPAQTSIFSSTSQTLADVGIALTITPSATNSKIFLQLSGNFKCVQPGIDYGNGPKFRLLRDAAGIAEWLNYFDYQSSSTRIPYAEGKFFGATLLDSPSSTSGVTYKLQAAKMGSYTATITIPINAASPALYYQHCRLVAMEIGV